MGSVGKIILSFFLLALFLALGSLAVVKYYERWARRMVYPVGSLVSKYPGEGRVTQAFEERLFVAPKFSGRLFSDEGKPFFAPLEDWLIYPGDRYEVFTIPAQEQLLYTVGKFEGWEDINDSLDKYMLVRLLSTNETERWRLTFDDEPTALAVEKIDPWPIKEKLNSTEKTNPAALSDLGFEAFKKAIKKGDTVILLPVFDAPELAKKDEGGNYLASWLLVRRAGGVESFQKELEGVVTNQ